MKIDLAQLEFINPILREMALSVEARFGVEFTITSLYRIPKDTPSSTHEVLPLRAIDLRCHDHDLGEAIENYVNSIYQYDPNRTGKKCCMYHSVGNSGYHIHLQVHPNTALR